MINHVSASNITYLLVSLFILYVGIILYVDGDYLYNKVRDFAIGRCKYSRMLDLTPNSVPFQSPGCRVTW